MGEFVQPRITVVRQDTHAIGTHAIDRLLARLDGDRLPRRDRGDPDNPGAARVRGDPSSSRPADSQRTQTAQSFGTPAGWVERRHSRRAPRTPSGSGTGSPPTLAITRTGAPGLGADVEGQHVLAEVDPGQLAAPGSELATQAQQRPVELEGRALDPGLPVDGEVAVHLRLRQPRLGARARSRTTARRPPRGSGRGSRRGHGWCARTSPRSGPRAASSGSWVASGSPSSSPW